MGCNYYARIIPSKERKKELYDAIEANDFHLIKKLTDEMYGCLDKNYDNDKLIGGEVHLGKASCGWKFLWNPNVFVVRSGHIEKVNGLMIIEVRDGETDKNPYRTGRIVGITKDAKEKMFKDINSPICYMEQSMFNPMFGEYCK